MKKKNIRYLFLVLFGGFMFLSALTPLSLKSQTIVDTSMASSTPEIIRQQMITEIQRLIQEIIKKLAIIASEQALNTQNQALSGGNASSTPERASSQKSSSSGSSVETNKPFGGWTTNVKRCTCSDYSLISITPPKPGLPDKVMYSKNVAQTYAYYMIPKEGVYLLGTHAEDVTCFVLHGNRCTPEGNGKKIVMVGTSGGAEGSAPSQGGEDPPPPDPYMVPSSTTTPPTEMCNPNGDRRAYVARGTGYYPTASATGSDENRMEGGPIDRRDQPLQTLQAYLAGQASYVSVAMDIHAFPYGTKLCIPELEKKYGRPIEFRVVDTGDAFIGMGTTRIDICTANNQASQDPTINGRLTLVEGDI